MFDGETLHRSLARNLDSGPPASRRIFKIPAPVSRKDGLTNSFQAGRQSVNTS